MFGRKTENWLIVGLGNPGSQYARTRHNCGFRAIDILAEQLSCKIDKCKFQGLYGQVVRGGIKLFLLKPQTYMNQSGRSVLQLSSYFNIPPQRIIVMFDDISLQPGRLRIRSDGSAGGHNGIKNIILHTGGQKFPRVRVGVGEKPAEYDLADYVLGHFSKEDQKLMDEAFKEAGTAAVTIMTEGIDSAMNKFNGKK